MKNKKLSKGLRKYIRHQKIIIRKTAKDEDQERKLIRELLDKFYKDQSGSKKMCCEECDHYEKCEEGNRLKNNCCPKCAEYYNCVGMDDREKDTYRDYRDDDSEDYF